MKTEALRKAFSCFVDREQEPSPGAVREALGRACAAWDELETHLADLYGLKGSLHFMYGARYGWALRFRRGAKLIVAMYPNHAHLTVQVVLGRAQVAMAAAMHLSSDILKVLRAAKDYPEGRWLFVPLSSLKSAQEMKHLIALKVSRAARGRTVAKADNGSLRQKSTYF